MVAVATRPAAAVDFLLAAALVLLGPEVEEAGFVVAAFVVFFLVSFVY